MIKRDTLSRTVIFAGFLGAFTPGLCFAGKVLSDRSVTFDQVQAIIPAAGVQVGTCRLSVTTKVEGGKTVAASIQIEDPGVKGKVQTENFSATDFPETDAAQAQTSPAFQDKDYESPANIGWFWVTDYHAGVGLADVAIYYDKQTKKVIGAYYRKQRWKGLLFDTNPVFGQLLPSEAVTCGNTGRMRLQANADGTRDIIERPAGDLGADATLDTDVEAKTIDRQGGGRETARAKDQHPPGVNPTN